MRERPFLNDDATTDVHLIPIKERDPSVPEPVLIPMLQSHPGAIKLFPFCQQPADEQDVGIEEKAQFILKRQDLGADERAVIARYLSCFSWLFREHVTPVSD